MTRAKPPKRVWLTILKETGICRAWQMKMYADRERDHFVTNGYACAVVAYDLAPSPASKRVGRGKK